MIPRRGEGVPRWRRSLGWTTPGRLWLGLTHSLLALLLVFFVGGAIVFLVPRGGALDRCALPWPVPLRLGIALLVGSVVRLVGPPALLRLVPVACQSAYARDMHRAVPPTPWYLDIWLGPLAEELVVRWAPLTVWLWQPGSLEAGVVVLSQLVWATGHFPQTTHWATFLMRVGLLLFSAGIYAGVFLLAGGGLPGLAAATGVHLLHNSCWRFVSRYRQFTVPVV